MARKRSILLNHFTTFSCFSLQPSVANAPANLVVSIHLPKLKSAKPCQLDVTERNLTLKSSEPAAYKLELKLPYPVDDENGSAKFDKTKKRLVSSNDFC